MTRRRFSEADVIYTLLLQGTLIRCYRCRVPVLPGDTLEREHLTPIALGGSDEPKNCRYSHAACHAKQTNGPLGKHTSLNSDKHAIAKTKRLQSGGRKRKGRKLQSKGFPKRYSKGMDGTVRERR